MDPKKYRDTVYKIIGAAMTVHEELNWGLLEAIYEEALSLELHDIGIDNKRQEEITTYYKHHLMEKKYKMDIVVDDIVIELKSTKNICSAHRAQLCNYLRLTHKPIGLIINFGAKSLQGERWIYDEETNECILVDKKMEPVFPNEDLFNDGSEYIEPQMT